MSHAIPIELRGESSTAAPVAPATQAVPLAPAAPTVVCAPLSPRGPKPVFARDPGKEWAWKEREIVSTSFRSAGLDAAYRAIPHRSKAAIRGQLQRCGLIVRRIKP